jgi:outer membrane protein assembly factor BamD
MNRTLLKALFLLSIAVLIAVMACSSHKLKANLPLKERMDLADSYFAKKRYLDAKDQYRIITLSYSGSRQADKAQFFLAECHFYTKEYIIAASEYERLIKVYPNSEYVDDAKYKLGFSYFKLSPRYSLDQEYTQKAIREFQEFLEEFRSSTLVPVVEKQLQECRNKLALKIFAAAEQYRRMQYWEAAVIYYNMVLDQYYDSIYAPRAQFYLADCYRRIGNFAEAATELKRFLEKFPQNEMAGKAKDQLRDVQARINDPKPAANSSGTK